MVTVGEVDVDVDFDGRQMRQQLRRLLNQAGRSGDEAGANFTKNFDKNVVAAGSKFERNLDRINGKAKKFGDSLDPARKALQRMSASARRLDNSSGSIISKWKNLGHNARQWTLIAAAIAAGGESIAGLGAGLGAGITTAAAALAGSLNAAAISAGALGASAIWTGALAIGSLDNMKREVEGVTEAFDNLGEAVQIQQSDLAAEWGPALRELVDTLAGIWREDDIGKAAGEALANVTDAFTDVLRSSAYKRFEGAMEDELPGALENIGETAASLTSVMLNTFAAAAPYVEDLTEKVQDFFEAWSEDIDAAVADGRFEEYLDIIFGYLEDLGSAALDFGGFIRDVFSAGTDAAQRFTQGLANLAGEWHDWSSSIEGQNTLTDWFEAGEEVMGAFGGLIENLALMLADLVDQETIDRVVGLIDALAEFVRPGGPLQGMLEALGELDIFGLIATSLTTFGDALEPLAQPMADLASAVNDMIQAGIERLAPVIEAVADALGPMATSIANVIKADPALAATLLAALAGAINGFIISKIAGVAGGFAKLVAPLLSLTSIKGIGKFGATFAGLALGIDTLFSIFDGSDSFIQGMFDLDSSLADLSTTGIILGARFGPIGAAIGGAVGLIASAVEDFEGTLNDIGPNLTTAVGGLAGPAGMFTGFFAGLFGSIVPDEWATSENPLKQAISGMAGVLEDPGTFLTTLPEQFNQMWTLINEGITTFTTGMSEGWTAWTISIQETWTTFWQNVGNPEFWFAIADSIGEWAAGLITGFGEWLATLFANWNTFWTGLPAAAAAMWTSLMASLAGWWASITRGFSSWWGGIKSGWSSFWNTLRSTPGQILNGIASTVRGWWSGISSTFRNAFSGITSAWSGFWNGLVGIVSGVVSTIIGIVNRILGPIQNALAGLSNLFSAGNSGGGNSYASGGIVAAPQRALIGEAGVEAVVPLQRPLSRVDPSVRALSAIAQGLASPHMAAGGVAGAGRSIMISPGAIVINGAKDGRRVALETVDRLVERMA